MSEKPTAKYERDFLKVESVNIVPIINPSDVPQIVRDFVGPSRQGSEWLQASIGSNLFYMVKFEPERDLQGLFLVQVEEGTVTGHAELNYGENSTFGPRGKPFTRFTMTRSGDRTGGAMRRLRVLDSYSLKVYGEHLYSGTRLEPGAKAMWEKMVAEDLAEPTVVGGSGVYRIK